MYFFLGTSNNKLHNRMLTFCNGNKQAKSIYFDLVFSSSLQRFFFLWSSSYFWRYILFIIVPSPTQMVSHTANTANDRDQYTPS